MIWLLILSLAGLLVYEVWALRRTEPGDTISEIVWKLSAKSRLVPFLGGLLCGHLFWNSCR